MNKETIQNTIMEWLEEEKEFYENFIESDPIDAVVMHGDFDITNLIERIYKESIKTP